MHHVESDGRGQADGFLQARALIRAETLRRRRIVAIFRCTPAVGPAAALEARMNDDRPGGGSLCGMKCRVASAL
jgi:hypothetical protein